MKPAGDSNAIRSFKDHFSGAASAYAEYRPRYPDALFDFAAGVLAPAANAWEAGCGSGQFTRGLARVCASVVATDASAQQLALAEQEAADLRPRVRFRCARAEQSGLADRSVDLAAVAQALHWFDVDRYDAEVQRVLRPGGCVLQVAYGRHAVEPAIDARTERFYSGDLNGHWPAERGHILDGYARLPFPYERIAAPPFELEARWRVEQVLGYIGTWSATQSLVRAGGGEAFERLRADLASMWGPQPRRVRWPLVVRVGRHPG